jgi:hypothetical protein
MVTSETEIANMALHHLGLERITALSDSNKRAKLLNDIFANTRDEVLSNAYWGFARRRVTIAKDATAPSFGFSARFQKPADLISVFWVDDHDPDASNNSNRYHPDGLDRSDTIAYREEGDYLLANADTLYMIYVKRLTDVTLFSAKFVTAFSLLLANRACYSLTQDKKLKDSLLAEYKLIVEEAGSLNAQGETAEDVEANYFIDPRF